MGLTGIGGDSEALNPLVDLTGDYDSHIRCLQYAQLCQRLALSTPALSDPPSLPSSIQNEIPGDTVSQSMPHGQNQFLRVNLNSLIVDPPMHPAPDSALPALAFGSEGMMQYAQRRGGFASSTPSLLAPPQSPSWIQIKKPQNTVSRSLPHGQNQFSHVNSNAMSVEPPMHPAADSALLAFASEGTIQYAQRCPGFASSTPALSVPPPSPSRSQNKRPQDSALFVPPPPPTQIQNTKPQGTSLSVSPPMPSRNQNKKPQNTVSQSIPQGQNNFSQVNLNPEFVEPPLRPAAVSAFPSAAFGSKGMMQSAQRNTCFPDTSHRNESAPTSHRSNSSTNTNREVRHARSKIRGRRSDAPSQPPFSFKDDNHASDSSSSSHRIEFGTIGDLAEDLISDPSLSWGFSKEAQGSKAVPKKERIKRRFHNCNAFGV
ncbi:Hypothetical predicted protein [Olea europaea subsp. europaea]|uniref:Uncharacterized protein n=1 Tax=Olea europaea subsp. europaea TaxID=158383 RepID=A0A8S0SDQ7_OLEEU|nr:Hypothetical predicted protein [Olea europaea subsp. europaea]